MRAPTVTFVVGLCGSGKTWLAERIIATRKFDEGFLLPQNRFRQLQELIQALRTGQDCVVVEIGFCRDENRQPMIQDLHSHVPNANIRWLCIENNLSRANKNCHEREGHLGDPEKQVTINEGLSPHYTYPEGAVVLSMWTRE